MKTKVHFTDSYLINPTNPVIINLIGSGGTGSQVLTALARINQSLVSLDHPGLFVRVFDNDIVTESNLGRQLFAASELGLNKAIVLICRLNRFFGTNWKAIPSLYNKKKMVEIDEQLKANITISCVDNAKTRFEIAEILRFTTMSAKTDSIGRPIYWLDFGNSQHTGQVILSTINSIKQPATKKYIAVDSLPFITDEFKDLLEQSDSDDTPSCSLAEALTKQDLFINSSLANLGASLLWNLFREGMIINRGFFLNLKEFRTQPLTIK